MIDRLADLLVRADAGSWYRVDDGLHPGDSVRQNSPYGNPPRWVSLRQSS